MIRLEKVSKRYGPDQVAVHELSMEIPDGRVTVLVGPSGCGKTTTLRMINRLTEPTSGRILIDGEDVMSRDPVVMRRGIGYVIQQGGLFPHRRVFDNVATVPRLLGWDRRRVEARVGELLELVGLDPAAYSRRFPHELSGGERQRVGVARALGADPPVLLMDEPFGAVDPVTRQRLQNELVELQDRLGKTVVFVTHDIEEAAKLGDLIAVMSRGGVLEQYDTPAEVLGRPATAFVADFVGTDRGVRRLGVVRVEARDLLRAPTVPEGAAAGEVARALAASEAGLAVLVDAGGHPTGWVTAEPGVRPLPPPVPVGETLRTALGHILQSDVGWLPVLDGAGALAGILDLDRLHAAMRRSAGDPAPEPIRAPAGPAPSRAPSAPPASR